MVVVVVCGWDEGASQWISGNYDAHRVPRFRRHEVHRCTNYICMESICPKGGHMQALYRDLS
jgi:hypothetical protein